MNDLQQLPPATGSALVESHRAVAEAIAARKVALANPRDVARVEQLIMNDCASLELAEEAAYQFARGGTDITGPSIRLLEVIARRYGNIECGVKELSRGPGYSDVLAYAIDLESGFTDKKEFQVRHVRDTKHGAKPLRDERDIYEVVANAGARRKRACLEAVIPTDIKDKALKTCQDTLLAKVKVTPDRINSMVQKFATLGVTQEMIEKRIQRKIEAIQAGHIVQLGRIYKSLQDDMSVIADWFEVPGGEQKKEEGGQPEKSTTDTVAGELAAKRAAQQAAQQAAPPKPPATGNAEETGEITQAFVRKAIEAAVTQDDMSKIFMGDMRKLSTSDPETRVTTKLWNEKVMKLAQAGDKPPLATDAPKPAAEAPAPQPAKAKPHGTAKVKATIRAAMNKATTQAELDAANAKVGEYAWDEGDRAELQERFKQCSEDLKAA